MRTLIFFGSARKNGNTAAILEVLLASSRGEIIQIDAFEGGFSACKNCGGCIASQRCVIEDSMKKIYNLMEDADNIVIASPIYFGSLTPPLLALMSRFQCFFSDFQKLPSVGKPKKGVIILTGGGSGVAGRAEADAKMMMKMLNARVLDVIISPNTNTQAAEKDAESILRAEAAAKLLFEV